MGGGVLGNVEGVLPPVSSVLSALCPVEVTGGEWGRQLGRETGRWDGGESGG